MFARLLSVLLLTLLTLATPAAADERILSFDADITVAENGTFLVKETIRVRSEEDQIRSGIFRDFPILLRNGWRNQRVGFVLQSATRDGQSEQAQIVESGKALRIYLGRAGRPVGRGEHVYELTYISDRQIRHVDGHDEVYWNATGTEWLFPIDRATATVRLPKGAYIRDIEAYTGAFGDDGADVRFRQQGDGTAFFETTRPLDVREGLTVAVAFEKGTISEPTAQQRREWLLRDHGHSLRAAQWVVGLAVFYVLMWWTWGRSPAPGVIVPRWEAPTGLSAALTRLVWNPRTQNGNLISLVLIEMASNGLINLDPSDGAPRLSIGSTTVGPGIPDEQKLVLDAIQSAGGELTIDRSNGEVVQRVESAIATSLRQQYRALQPRRRAWQHVLIGLIASGAVVLAIALPMPEPMNVAAIVLTMLLFFAAAFLSGKDRKAITLFALFMLSPFLVMLCHIFVTQGDPVFLVVILAVVVMTRIVLSTMGGPTVRGRKVLDEIEGLQEYIRVAESERLRIAGAPDMSRPHFERILPFAMAMDLEDIWVGHFQNWLANAQPVDGIEAERDHDRARIGWHLSSFYVSAASEQRWPSLYRQLSASLTSALPVASAQASGFSSLGSSSGFSSGSSSRGGSSGGGGGGGGGGGW